MTYEEIMSMNKHNCSFIQDKCRITDMCNNYKTCILDYYNGKQSVIDLVNLIAEIKNHRIAVTNLSSIRNHIEKLGFIKNTKQNKTNDSGLRIHRVSTADLQSVDLKAISKLNEAIYMNELFRCAISTDSGVRNSTNYDKCAKIIELYSYLYLHSSIINNLFDDNPYMNNKIINNILEKMETLSITESIISTIKDFKKIIDKHIILHICRNN